MLGNEVLGRGSVRLKMFDGVERILGDSRYVPALKKRGSLRTLDKLGYYCRI